jgi:superfamily II DNA or RNA helicase
MPGSRITKKHSSTLNSSKHTASSKKTLKISKKSISKTVGSSLQDDLDKYRPLVNTDIIHPSMWELPNRKHFYNWVMDTFGRYELGNPKRHKKFEPRISEHFELSSVQRLMRDYLQDSSPVRGMLLYQGLGSGKTCAGVSIAESNYSNSSGASGASGASGVGASIAEAMRTKRKVVIFSKAALESNWIKEFKLCGADYYRIHNHWVFKPIYGDASDDLKHLMRELEIPLGVLDKNRGVFLIDFTKHKSNFNELSEVERAKLDYQIAEMMDARIEFIHSDNTSLWKKFDPTRVNGKILIWDEAHHLGNKMASKSLGGANFYEMFMNAIDVKLVFLSATPIINRIFEITKIFNILKGYMHVLEISFRGAFDTGGIDYDKVKYNLKKNKHVDQIILNKTRKIIKVSPNPAGFITSPDNKGLLYRPKEAITHEEFLAAITRIVESLGYKVQIKWLEPQTLFPENEDKFEEIFYNRELNRIKKPDVIKRRIAGLTSYYEYKDASKFPSLLAVNKLQVPMSEFQFGTYERFRHQEIQEDKKIQRRNAKEDEDLPSSYRLRSRLTCAFAFPEEIGNPYDARNAEDRIELIEKVQERLSSGAAELRPSTLEMMRADQIKEALTSKYIDVLDKRKAEYLDVRNGSLAKYSPKYLTALMNINKQAPMGKILVFTFFLRLIGLGIFSLVLQQSGKWAPFRIKKVNKQWMLDSRPEDEGKWRYVFYSGDETQEQKDIYRKIINSEWHTLGADCTNLVKELKAIHPNNYTGEIIKMMLITVSGAEGLDLKEIRYIHILEPHWQNALLDQIIGRGVRKGSHLALPEKHRTVEAFIYMATLTPALVRKITHPDVRNDVYKYPNPAFPDKANKVVSSDEHLFLTAERKRYIINEFQRLMKESAFDCALNYRENKLNPDYNGITCIDYSTRNRDDYLSTPMLEDEGLEIAPERVVSVKYETREYKGKLLYIETVPNAMGKMYIYDENLVGRVRLPKPIGEVIMQNGLRKLGLYSKKPKSKSQSKAKTK